MAQDKITVKLVKSTNGRLKSHKDCVRGLGLRKLNDIVTVDKTPENMGMINKVSYLLEIQ